jgi:integrase
VSIALSAAIESYIQSCTTQELAKSTVKGYRVALTRFLNFVGDLDLATLENEAAIKHIGAYLEHRREVDQIRYLHKDRIVFSGFFNYLRGASRRWYRGENPATAKVQDVKNPRKQLRPKRCTSEEEDLILRTEGHKSPLWPMILLARWAGMRRGEICTLRWSEVNLTEGYADVVGHELGRKHPRRVGLAPWVVVQLRTIRPPWLPEGQDWPVWPFHYTTASHMLEEFCAKHLKRQVTYNALRASFATEGYGSGMTAEEEASMAGHSPAVARRHYLEWAALEARFKLPGDPLLRQREKEPPKAPDAKSDAVSG